MKNPEFNPSPRQFPTIEIEETECQIMLPVQLHRLLREFIEDQGSEPENVLYTGVDLEYDRPLINGFGDRVKTWGYTDIEVAEAARRRGPGEHVMESPFYWALNGTAAAGVVLTDATQFNQLGVAPDDSEHLETEYHLRDGVTSFDDAVIGIVRIVS